MPTPHRPTPTASNTTDGPADPPVSPGVIWAASILATPATGFWLYVLWRRHRPKAATHAVRAACFGVVAWFLALDASGCLRARAPASSPAPSVARSRSTPTQVEFTQIMLAYARAGGVATATRTREAAFALARTLIARIRGGTSMEDLVAEYTDDRGDDGRPFNGGSYTMTRSKPAVAAIKDAAFALDVGQLSPDPIDSGYAVHVIRRDH